MDSVENAEERQARNRSTLYMLLFFGWLLFLNLSDDESARRGRPSVEELIDSLHIEKQSLGNATFGINITHVLPSAVESQIQQLNQHKTAGSHYYHNITGVFRGNWHSENVTLPEDDPASNKTLQSEARGEFRIEGDGTYSFSIKSISTSDESVNYLEGYMWLRDVDKVDNGALLLAEGVHFLNSGSLYLVGISNRSKSYSEELLHMLPTNESMIQARTVLIEKIDKQIEELKEMDTRNGEWPSDELSMSVEFDCAYEIFAQLHPVSRSVKLQQLLEYERELENPQGISTISAPPLVMSSVMYSPNCGLVTTANETTGTRMEQYYSKSVSYAGMAIVLSVIQIFSLIQQMEYTSTPSSVSNVSYWTIAMQAMMDGYLCLLHLTTGVVVESVFLHFAAAAFFNFILVSVFSMRYLLLIWRIQRPENARPVADTNTSTLSATTTDNSNNEQRTILPLIVNRRQMSENDGPRDFSRVYYRVYFVLLVGLIIFYQAVTRSAFAQNVIISVCGVIFYSFWIPQITRNVIRGCRKPLSRRYVLTMSLTRLAIPLYFFGCPHNLVDREPTPWVWALVAYVGLQVGILTLQDILGPRFFVSERSLPQTYNYHPILPPPDEEYGTTAEAGNNICGSRDCAICMLPVDTSTTGPPGLHVLGRAQYMMTPCQHLFHTDCLEKWMRIKLECPVCRSYLPAS